MHRIVRTRRSCNLVMTTKVICEATIGGLVICLIVAIHVKIVLQNALGARQCRGLTRDLQALIVHLDCLHC